MSKKINKKFLKLYVELDSLCCDRLNAKAGGVTEYINRLESARFAPKRDEVLAALNKYRNVRNVLATDAKAMKKNNLLTKGDLKWIKKFNKSLKRKKDSITTYLRKARKFAKNRKLKRGIAVVAVAGVAAAAALVLPGLLGGNEG
jgi:hypothetical protein